MCIRDSVHGVRIDLHPVHLTALNADHFIANSGQCQVVGDDHHRHPCSAAGILQKFEDGLARGVIQRAGGLVAKQQLGVLGQRPGNSHTLLLTAGQLGGEVVLALFQPHIPDHFVQIQWLPANLGSQLHVLPGRKILHQIIKLEDKAYILSLIHI